MSFRSSLSVITQLEAHRGRESRGAAGAYWGGLIGAFTGTVAVAATSCWGLDLTTELCLLLGPPPGFIVGAFLGALSRTDRWEEIPLPPVQASLIVSPEGRLAFGFSRPLRR